MPVLSALVILLLVTTGCGDAAAPPADLSGAADLAVMLDLSVPRDMVAPSSCGHPGDTGNDKGVGKYCTDQNGCAGNGLATLCSVLGNVAGMPSPNDSYFCTFLCASVNAGGCGMNASCECSNAGCACAPHSCTNRDGG